MTSRHAVDEAVRGERLRIARELHDTIGQALYGIALGAQSAGSCLETDPRRATEALAYIQAVAENARIELRALLFDLRLDTLAAEGLRDALSRWGDFLHARYGLTVRVVVDDESAVPATVKGHVFAIVREATTNVVRHARAHQVTLVVRRTSELEVTIADDGIGFDPAVPFPDHFGLAGMRERVAALGGRLAIASSPGAGTTVSAIIPFPPK
ncbi:MAG TPA: sensor histidine kinase [Chloroflexota bacterium]|nr:sensor histidine kinase [Chloroflexota bacterium]